MLNMYIGKVLIESVEICYDGLVTCDDREKYNESIVSKLENKHKWKTRYSKNQPVFFIEGVQSKMNYSLVNYVDEYQELHIRG